MGHHVSINLDLGNELLKSQYQVVEELLFEGENLVLSTQNLLLILLQLLRDITFCLGQRLLANPLLGHLFLIGVAHLQIVAKHIVIAYLQRGDACLLGFALLNLEQIVLTRIGNMAQLVEFCIHPIANHSTLGYQLRRIVLYLALYPVANRLAEVQLLPYPFQRFIVGIETSCLDGLQGLQGHLQLYHLTRRYSAYSHL